MDWFKRNKLSTLLLLILILLFGKNLLNSLFGVDILSMSIPSPPTYEGYGSVNLKQGSLSTSGLSLPSSNYYRSEYTPTNQKDRLVVQETSLSLVVTKVRESTDSIIEKAKQLEGYLVSSSLSQPEEAPFSSVIIRVPSDKLKDALQYLRSLAVKVTSENVIGTDVTDEYVDIDSRLATLQSTKTKFESILNQATQIQDILNVQREIISLQDQIDSLKGRQKYLEQTAKLSKIIVYLSTDELALPYAPTGTFRPAVIFKMAVRSLVGLLRGAASLSIWVIVYAVIWVPLLVGVIVIRKLRSGR